MVKLTVVGILYIYVLIVLIIALFISFLVFLYGFNAKATVNAFETLTNTLVGNRIVDAFEKWDPFR